MATVKLTRDAIVAYLQEVRIVEDEVDREMLVEAEDEIRRYVWTHGRAAALAIAMLKRHVRTTSRDRPLRVLELGGAPYLFTALMSREFCVDLTAVNVEAGSWPGETPRRTRGKVVLRLPGDEGVQQRLEINTHIFNVEKDPFPFEDDSFDVVLCMEILEHLGYSPSHMLAESHRVLKEDGLLFITVPNFINIKRTINMILNLPSEYRYSGYGIYGRHQREFAPFEVTQLLQACRYRVAELQTANVWPTFTGSRLKGIFNGLLNLVTSLPFAWFVNKREYILCAAHPYGDPLVAYPAWLYEHRTMFPEPPHGLSKRVD